MFWKLGALSAWRNLARSLLAVVSMAMASGFFIDAVAMSRGYVAKTGREYRSYLGGEISAYAWNLSGSRENLPPDSEWTFWPHFSAENTDIATFMPELTQGVMMPQSQASPFTADLLSELAAIEGVDAVYPRWQLAAQLHSQHGTLSRPLRGRDAALDQFLTVSPAELVQEGRWFGPADEGKYLAIVSSRQRLLAAESPMAVGDLLQLSLPRLVRNQDGSFRYDYSDPIRTELMVIGVMDIPSRNLEITGNTDINVDPPRNRNLVYSDTLYAFADDIQIPLSTWQDIWLQVSGGMEYLPTQAQLIVRDISYLEDICLEAARSFPANSFFTVPTLIQKAAAQVTLENPAKLSITADLARTLARKPLAEQEAVGMDLRLPMVVLIFFNAAMVIMSNLLILVQERRTEAGILKAVGSLKRQVLVMIVSEALVISLIGALIGFLVFRLPTAAIQATNNVSIGEILRRFGFDLLLTVGSSSLAAVLFGLLPAFSMATLSVREVMQED